MALKVFLTGVTGYVGGTLFQTLLDWQLEYEITAYVRKVPDDFEKNFPRVKLVYGTWNDSDILRKAASEADVVVQCGNSDHIGAVTALLEGVVEGAQARNRRKGFYIHLSGTATIADFAEPNAQEFRGKLNPRIYSDITDIDVVTSRPKGTPHQHTDKPILEAGEKYKDILGIAIVCPPDMYGKGGGSASWGKGGYYFATTEEATQKNLATATAKTLHAKGIISSPEAKQVNEVTIEGTLSHWGIPGLGWYMFAGNSRAKAERAAKELRWKPQAKKLHEEVENDILRALESGFRGQLDLGQ